MPGSARCLNRQLTGGRSGGSRRAMLGPFPEVQTRLTRSHLLSLYLSSSKSALKARAKPMGQEMW